MLLVSRPRYPGPDAIAAVTALICLRYLAERTTRSPTARVIRRRGPRAGPRLDPNDDVLLTEIRSIPPTAGWLVALVDDLIEASWSCREAFERVMAARHRFRRRRADPPAR